MQNKEKDFFKLLDSMISEQLSLQEVRGGKITMADLAKGKKDGRIQRTSRITSTKKEPEPPPEDPTVIVREILNNLKVIPSLDLTDFVGQNANVESDAQRIYSEQLLSEIIKKGSTFKERLMWISNILSREEVLSETEFMSTLVFLKTLKELIENYREQTGGFLFENFFAQLAGGRSLPEKDIQDVIVGNTLYSLKLLSEQSAVGGSLTNLVNSLVQHPHGIQYVVAVKSKTEVQDLNFDGELENVVASVKFYERTITMEDIRSRLLNVFRKITIPEELLVSYSGKNNSLGIPIIDYEGTSPLTQLENFIANLKISNSHEAKMFKEILFDLLALKAGENFYRTGFTAGASRDQGAKFSFVQSSFTKASEEIGSINITAESLSAFYKKNSSNVYNNYINILKKVSEQTRSINAYLTTGEPSQGSVAIKKTEETKSMLDASVGS